MNSLLISYILGLSVATVTTLAVTVMTLRHRDRPHALSLGLTMLAVAEWCVFYLLEATATTISAKALWSQFAYIGTQTAVPLLLTFAAQMTQNEHLLKRPVRIGMWSVPMVSLVLVFTNGQHGLIWRDLYWADEAQRILVYEHGTWFWVLVSHVYVMLTVASVLMIRTALHMRRVYRRQSVLILIAIAIPWAINAVYLFQPRLLGYLDWSPVGFAGTGLLLTWAFRELQLLDLMPIARDLVVENILDGVLVLDAFGRVVDVNAAGQRILGDQNVIGRNALALYAGLAGLPEGPNVGPNAGKRPTILIPDADAREGEITDPSGRVISWQIAPLSKQPRHLAGHIVLLRDITEQRAAEKSLHEINVTLENQVKARTAEIEASRQRSEAILRSVTDAIMMTDRDLTIQYINPAFSKITGFTYETAVGTQITDGFRGDLYSHLVEARDTGRNWQGEIRIHRADGRLVDLAVDIVPVHDETGEPVGLLCTGQDISLLVNLVRTRKGILDNISHQLRTPVTTLRLYTHLLRRTELSEIQERHLAIIHDQTTWLQHMIEDILEMTSLDSGEATGIWSNVPVMNLVSLSLDHHRTAVAASGLTIHAPQSLNTGRTVNGDETRLVQAMGEIINNAITFTPNGGSISISLREGEIEGQPAVGIAVTDTGVGIPVDEQDRVFERFFRGRVTDAGQIPGTGLGLSIAATIIRAHGGYIDLDSDVDGSTFIIWLPLAPAHDNPPRH